LGLSSDFAVNTIFLEGHVKDLGEALSPNIPPWLQNCFETE
jgi:hypothetical protein